MAYGWKIFDPYRDMQKHLPADEQYYLNSQV